MTHHPTATRKFQDRCRQLPGSSRLSFETSRFMHPDDVLGAPDLSHSDKRAILASWLSDSRALENAPALRQIDCGALVRVDDLMRALSSLDEASFADDKLSGRTPPMYPRHPPETRIFKLLGRVTRWKGPDDDDPPPCPVAARPRDHGPTPQAAAQPDDDLICAAA
jgi:hypothetical protein